MKEFFDSLDPFAVAWLSLIAVLGVAAVVIAKNGGIKSGPKIDDDTFV